MTVNVVLLVRDRPELTRQALATIFSHETLGLFNLIIVDDGSASPTRDVVETYSWSRSGCVSVRLSPGQRIVGLARNLGIMASERIFGRGDFLYLSDNDIFFRHGWLDGLIAAWPRAEDLGFKILGLVTHPFHGVRESFPLGDGRIGELHAHDAVAGASHFMKWETWDAYQPFDAHATGTGQSEDWAFCQKVIAAGGRVGTLWPYLAANCGVTDSSGNPTPGADAVMAQTQEFISRHNLHGRHVVIK